MPKRIFTKKELAVLKNGGQQAIEPIVEGVLSKTIIPDLQSIKELMGVIGNNIPTESPDKARRYRLAVSTLEDQWDQAFKVRKCGMFNSA